MSSEEAILLHNNHLWEIKKLKRFGDLLVDKMSGKIYAVDGNKITIKKGRRTKSYYLIDPEKGVSLSVDLLKNADKGTIDIDKSDNVRIEKDETVLKLKTNPEMIYHAIEGGLLLKLFKVKPTMGQVVAGIILGLIIGVIIGGILF